MPDGRVSFGKGAGIRFSVDIRKSSMSMSVLMFTSFVLAFYPISVIRASVSLIDVMILGGVEAYPNRSEVTSQASHT